MAMRTRFLWTVLLALLAFVLGCSEDLKPPVAGIRLSDTVFAVGARVSLDGSGSMSSGGRPLSYRFRVAVAPPGSVASIADVSATKTWISPDVAGDYTIELVVSDGVLTSLPATATFTAGPCGANAPRVASITTTPGTPWPGQAVLLTAAVTDADNQCGRSESFTYAWSLVGLPAASRASLNDPALASPSLLTDLPGDYRVRLVVTDSAGNQGASFETTLTVAGCVSPPGDVTVVTATPGSPGVSEVVALAASVMPRASSGSSTTINDAGVPLDGASPDGAPLPAPAAPSGAPQTVCTNPHYTYHWAIVGLPAASRASLNGTGLESPSFSPDVPGDYVFEVYTTNDAGVAGATFRTTVTAGACGTSAPVVASVSASSSAPAIGQAVLLSAVVTDADSLPPCNRAETPTYVWRLTRVPAGSVAKLNDPALAGPSFRPDVAGTYEATLTVVDPAGHASQPVSTTLVANACGSNAPVVTDVSATPAAPRTLQTVVLSAAVSDADTASPCGRVESFSMRWALTAVPAGSRSALSGTTQTSPWFIPDLPGTYSVEARAVDAAGHVSAPQTLAITVSTCGSSPPVVASIGFGPAAPTVGSGVSVNAVVLDADTGPGCGLAESFRYAWALVSVPPGSVAALTSATSPVTGFTPDVSGIYTVRLVVTDAAGHVSSPLQQSLSVAPASACGTRDPVALLASFTAGPCVSATCTAATITPAIASGPRAIPPSYTIQLNGHGSVLLDGSRTFDPDNLAPCFLAETLFYQWSLLAAPLGSQATWSIGSGPTTSMVAPTFNPDLPGIYQVQLIASDGVHVSAPLVVQIQL